MFKMNLYTILWTEKSIVSISQQVHDQSDYYIDLLQLYRLLVADEHISIIFL